MKNPKTLISMEHSSECFPGYAQNRFVRQAPVIHWLALPVLLACSLFTAASAQINYDFDADQADFNTKFLENISAGTPAWATGGINATGGVNNSGFLGTNSSTQAALYDQAFPWAVGQTYTMSVYFKARVTAGSVAAGGSIRLGIGDDSAATLNGLQYVAATIIGGATSDSTRLALVSRQSGTNTAAGTDLGILTDNHWYQMTAAFTKSATTDRIDATISLYDWGADGITGGSLVGNSGTLSATGLTDVYNSSGVYFGIGGASNGAGNGVRGFDKLTAGAPFDAPTGLAATEQAGPQVLLNWSEAISGEEGFRVLRRTGSSGNFSQIATTLANATSYLDSTSLIPGKTYEYQLVTFGSTQPESIPSSSAVVTLVPTSAISANESFEAGQADFNSKFHVPLGSGVPNWISGGLTATGGVNDSGYLATSANAQTALYDQASTWATGETFVLSTYFKGRVTATTAAGGALRLGFTSNRNGTLFPEFVAVGIDTVNSTESQLVVVSRETFSNTVAGPNLGTLTDNNWYQISGTFTKTADSGTFDVTVSLRDWGVDGVTDGGILGTSSVVNASGAPGVYNSTGVFAGFTGVSNSAGSGVRGFDEFSAQLQSPSGNGLVSFRNANGLAANGSDDLLTPAGDGVENLLKYAFNMIGAGPGQAADLTIPNVDVMSVSGTAGLPLITTNESGALEVRYIRRVLSSNPGITYAVEFGDTLSDFAPNASATESVESIDSTFERVIVTDSVSAPGKRFARLAVTAIP